MAGGLPNPDTFPFTSMALTLRDGSTTTLDEKDMESVLQYGITSGHPRLTAFLDNMMRRLHAPPLMDGRGHPGSTMTVCTAGSQDGIYKTFESLIDEGDTVITEEPVYSALLTVLVPYGCKIQGIKTDSQGMVPESLRQYLSSWKPSEDGKPSTDSSGSKLKALYVIPNGGNPSGARYTLERKTELYKLAQEYNFIILEDEAYYFLEKRPYSKSFLSLDVDGRVMRLDSFSKTVGPGFRIGTVTGPTALVEKVLQTAQASSQGCSMVSQSILVKLLDRWGLDGYMEHCGKVAEYYDNRRKQCMEIADRHLKGLVEYDAPSGGMFLWLRCKGVKDTTELCLKRLVQRKVLMVAGSAFMVNEEASSPYIRVSFTMASPETLEKGFETLAEELRKLAAEES